MVGVQNGGLTGLWPHCLPPLLLWLIPEIINLSFIHRISLHNMALLWDTPIAQHLRTKNCATEQSTVT